MNSKEEVLAGGLMNAPIRRKDLVYKEATNASQTVHELLQHVRNRGITWIPESKGINSEGKHVFTYIEGEVPHDTPEWLWSDTILLDAARKLRMWHDATIDFEITGGLWLLENEEKHEVICHNDFAPYNCVFQDEKLIGLIDFDLCSPGSRLWDIAYTVYRFVPLLPIGEVDQYIEVSPISYELMMHRLEQFLAEYSKGESSLHYRIQEVIPIVVKRLKAIADWSNQFGIQTQNKDLIENAKMYQLHAVWLNNLLKETTNKEIN